MKKITGRVFVRAEHETESRPWESLSKEEIETICDCINREAARAGGFREVA